MVKFSILYVGVLGLFLTGVSLGQTFDNTKHSIPMTSTFNSGPLICKLTGPELAKRLEQLKFEVFAAVKKTEEVNDGFMFHFSGDSDFALKLMDYILSERSCCPFFSFELSFPAHRNAMALKISGPPEAKEMIRMFLKD